MQEATFMILTALADVGRDEFRRHCDRHRSRDRILANLS